MSWSFSTPLDAPHALPVPRFDGWSENLVHPSILLNTLCRIHLFGAGYGVFDVSLWPISVDSAVIDVELEVDDSSSKLLI